MVDTDAAGRGCFNAIFGDRVSARRTSDVSVAIRWRELF
jgi:hypothetical protein